MNLNINLIAIILLDTNLSEIVTDSL